MSTVTETITLTKTTPTKSNKTQPSEEMDVDEDVAESQVIDGLNNEDKNDNPTATEKQDKEGDKDEPSAKKQRKREPNPIIYRGQKIGELKNSNDVKEVRRKKRIINKFDKWNHYNKFHSNNFKLATIKRLMKEEMKSTHNSNDESNNQEFGNKVEDGLTQEDDDKDMDSIAIGDEAAKFAAQCLQSRLQKLLESCHELMVLKKRQKLDHEIIQYAYKMNFKNNFTLQDDSEYIPEEELPEDQKIKRKPKATKID